MQRRTWLQAAAATIAAPSLGSAFAQAKSGQLQIIVPFAPGGSGDITARLLGSHISAKTGQTVVVDNRPGANGIIGVEAVRAMPADGTTLLLATTSTHAANPNLYRKLPYDPDRDFSMVGIFGSGGGYMLVRPDAPYKTFADFVTYAKARPGQLNYGHFNASSKVPGALMGPVAGVQLSEVPYKQIGAAMTDLMAGQIQVIFVDTAAGDALVASGQLRALAVTRKSRLAKYPDLPAIAETYPDFDLSGFLGVAVKAGTPHADMERFNALVNEAITHEPMKGKLDSFGFTPTPMTLAECVASVKAERVKWAKYVAAAKLEVQ